MVFLRTIEYVPGGRYASERGMRRTTVHTYDTRYQVDIVACAEPNQLWLLTATI